MQTQAADPSALAHPPEQIAEAEVTLGTLSQREQAQLLEMAQALSGKTLCVLSGAGCSTESGIPDYRGEETARRARNPIQFKQFVGDEAGRRRYWARSLLGFKKFVQARPNPGHLALARLEHAGLATGVITQNVDRLHHQAGSREVVELHGALAEVICLSCGQLEARADLQLRLEAENPEFSQLVHQIAPDGDADIVSAHETELLAAFRVQGCLHCGGVLKPHVVFFGEGVPKQRVERAFELQEQADALLVVGSSLTVFSGFRFPRHALKSGQPVFIINRGKTRADAISKLKLDLPLGPALTFLEKLLLASSV